MPTPNDWVIALTLLVVACAMPLAFDWFRRLAAERAVIADPYPGCICPECGEPMRSWEPYTVRGYVPIHEVLRTSHHRAAGVKLYLRFRSFQNDLSCALTGREFRP